MDDGRGTLQIGEFHPSAPDALLYIQELGFLKHSVLMEAFASTALSGNRLSDICLETLRRIMNAEPVSDRYVLGLAWFVRNMDEMQNDGPPCPIPPNPQE